MIENFSISKSFKNGFEQRRFSSHGTINNRNLKMRRLTQPSFLISNYQLLRTVFESSCKIIKSIIFRVFARSIFN